MQPYLNQQNLFKEPKITKFFFVLTTFYKIIQVLCCLDFGFFENKSKRTKVLWKLCTIFYLISIICISFYFTFVNNFINESDRYVIPGFIFYMIRFILNVIYLTFFNQKNTFCQFLRDIDQLDSKLGEEHASYNIDIKILICVVCNTVFFCTLGFLSFPPDNLKLGIFCTIMAMMTTSDSVVVMTCTFFFYSINSHLKTFTSILKNGENTYPMHRLYKSIADLTEEYMSTFDVLFFTTLLFTTCEVMGNVVYIVNEIKVASSVQFGLNNIGLFIHLVYMFAPAMYAEMIATKANNVKLILHNKLLNEKDSSRRLELERFIRYVEARPLRFRVYRVIPLDASLLGMVLNFIVTYLIVILQFMFKK